jgi:hypothetical protein
MLIRECCESSGRRYFRLKNVCAWLLEGEIGADILGADSAIESVVQPKMLLGTVR